MHIQVVGSQPGTVCLVNNHDKTWSLVSNSSFSGLKLIISVLQRLSYIEGRLPLRIFFHLWTSSIVGHIPSKAVFNQRLSSQVLFLLWSSSIKGHLLSKGVFHQRISSIKGCLPLKDVLHKRTYSIKGRRYWWWVIGWFNSFSCLTQLKLC